MFFELDPWSSAPVTYSSIQHDYAQWIRNFMVMMKKPENLFFETWQKGKMANSELMSVNLEHCWKISTKTLTQ
jgi:hypothetical protein